MTEKEQHFTTEVEGQAASHETDSPRLSLIDTEEWKNMSEADRELAAMGYKPQFKREFSYWSAFSFAVSVSGLFATITTTFSYPLTSGGAACTVWSWLIGGSGCLCIALAVAELVSAYPTAGGMYFTCNYTFPKKYIPLVSWIDGWMNLLGQIAGVASSDYGAAQMLLAAVSMGSNFTYQPTDKHTVGVMAAILIFHGLISSMPTKYLEKLTGTYIIFHVAVLVSCCVALLVKQEHRHTGEYVFTHVESTTGWQPLGFSFLFGFLSVSWTMTDYDATAHVAEEMDKPEVKAPFAIAAAMIFTYIVGFLFNIVLAFCMGDPESIMNSIIAQPVCQIFYNVLGMGGGVFFTVAAFIIMNFVAISAIHACSRTIFAFGRDRMLPLSNVWGHVDKNTKTPLYAVWLTVVACIAINLIGLGSYTTISAIFNVCAIALDWSYCIPIIGRLIWPDQVKKGPWNLGRFSYAVNLWAVAWTFFVSIIFFMPTVRPVTPSNMNYAVVFFVGIIVFSLIYWAAAGHKYYTGPRANTHVIEAEIEKIEKQERESREYHHTIGHANHQDLNMGSSSAVQSR